MKRSLILFTTIIIFCQNIFSQETNNKINTSMRKQNIAIVYPAKLPEEYRASIKKKDLIEFYDNFILKILECKELNQLTIIHRSGLSQILNNKFKSNKVNLIEIDDVQDIWIRDFAPIYIIGDIAMKSLYAPAYFKESDQKYALLDNNTGRIVAESLGFKTIDINICNDFLILDGGNIIYNNGTGFTTNRIISDNESKSIDDIKNYFSEHFGINKLLILPVEPGDETGHIDGMVRFINDSTIVVGAYPDNYQEGKIFMDKIANLIQSELPDFKIIRVLNEIPPDPDSNYQIPSAFGNYINFLVIGETLFMPKYGIEDKDYAAYKIYKKYFKNVVFIEKDIEKLASLGGVLNCITWNY